MSVNIATMGMFRDCCGGGPGTGGSGAVPGVGDQREAKPTIYVRVKNVDIESKNITLSKIKVTLKSAGE
jgi:hypothetical protein